MSTARLLARRVLTQTAVRICATAIAIGGLAVGAAATAAPAQAATRTPIICLSCPWMSLTPPVTARAGVPVTLTATSSFDVGPTRYWIGIYDATTGTWVRPECGFGTTCSATVLELPGTTHVYEAVVGLLGALPYSSGALMSAETSVHWQIIR